MIVFVLPGFTSHTPNRKFETLRKYLPSCNVIGLSYHTYDPLKLKVHFDETIKLCKSYYNDDDIVFVGTSLGGFWAKYLALTYDSKAIMINPAIHPLQSLKPHIGLNKNVYTNEIFELTEHEVNDYLYFYNANIDFVDLKALVLLDKEDELFNSIETANFFESPKNTKCITFDGGNHGFQHMKESLPYIKEFLEIL